MLTDWSIRAGKLIADALAQLEGLPAQPGNAWLAFAVQAQREDAGGSSTGAQNNNPLNLTTANGSIHWAGQIGTYGGGDAQEWHGDFASFSSLEAGAWACATNLHNGAAYAGVRLAFKTGDAIALAKAIELSPWDSGHYGGTLAIGVRIEAAQEDDAMITREQYAEQIEPLVKETIKVMIEQDPETRNAIASLVPAGTPPAFDVDAVAHVIAGRLSASTTISAKP